MADPHSTEELPAPVPAEGVLLLHTRQGATRTALCQCLAHLSARWREVHEDILSVPVSGNRLHALCEAVVKSLSKAQLREVRYCLIGDAGCASPAALMQTHSLTRLVAQVQGTWLVDLLRGERLRTFFQPIVYTGEPTQVFAYECLLRAFQPDGGLVYPHQVFEAARATDLLYYVDRMARLTAVKAASVLPCPVNVFINFNPASIEQPEESLKSTVAAVQSSGIPPERFVFEVVESEQARDRRLLLRIVDYFRSCGCRVALDDLGAGYSSLNLLTEIRPDFVKLDIGLMRNVDCDLYKARVAGKLIELAKDLRAATVVEGLETPGEWQWALEHEADYAQGFLFAKPAEVPPQPEFCNA